MLPQYLLLQGIKLLLIHDMTALHDSMYTYAKSKPTLYSYSVMYAEDHGNQWDKFQYDE